MDRGEYIDRRTEQIKQEAFALIAALSLTLSSLGFKTDDRGRMVFDIAAITAFRAAFSEWAKTGGVVIIGKMGALMHEAHDLVLDAYRNKGFDVTASRKILSLIDKLGFSKPTKSTLGATIAAARPVESELHAWVVRSMASNKPFNDFLGEIGTVVPEKFDRYYKTHLYDMGMQFERISNNRYAEELGLTHFIYAGGVIDTTRQFCADRAFKAFSLDQAREWNDLSWRGKIEGEDVLVALGGYNCRHYMDYITEDAYERLT